VIYNGEPVKAKLLAQADARETYTAVVGSRLYPTSEDWRELYSNAVGIDLQDGEGVDIVHDLNAPLHSFENEFQHVHCCSVMEHTTHPWIVADNITRLLQPGGTLFLTVPFVWRVHNYPGDYFRFTRDGIIHLFHDIEWEQLVYASHGEKVKRPLGETIDGMCYMERTEVVGIGRRR
jgi:SAM-dependent methyltransferase